MPRMDNGGPKKAPVSSNKPWISKHCISKGIHRDDASPQASSSLEYQCQIG